MRWSGSVTRSREWSQGSSFTGCAAARLQILGDISDLGDGREQPAQLLFVERAVRADAGADVEGERSHRLHGLGGVLRGDAPGQEDRDIHRLAYPPAQAPIVAPAGPAQLLDRGVGAARIEQDGVR